MDYLSNLSAAIREDTIEEVCHGPSFYCTLHTVLAENGIENVGTVQLPEEGLAAGQFAAFYEGQVTIVVTLNRCHMRSMQHEANDTMAKKMAKFEAEEKRPKTITNEGRMLGRKHKCKAKLTITTRGFREKTPCQTPQPPL
ncbi:hypothetical protein Tco_0282342 [Tanacetum coccineum]